MRGPHKYLTVPPRPLGPDALQCLKVLAEQGAAVDFVATSSREVAERLGVSQQTASRKILELAKGGLIARRMGQRRQLLRVTPEGLDVLRREAESYRRIFAPQRTQVRFRGRVAKGLGEGGWYLSRPGYMVPMQRLLGFAPYPGTLNLALEGPEVDQLRELRDRDGLLVPEFRDEGRSFGAVKCFPGKLQGIEAAAVVPLRGHHERVLEVVAPVNLREKLGLRDGDVVAVDVEL
jgi:riboflavin kinase